MHVHKYTKGLQHTREFNRSCIEVHTPACRSSGDMLSHTSANVCAQMHNGIEANQLTKTHIHEGTGGYGGTQTHWHTCAQRHWETRGVVTV